MMVIGSGMMANAFLEYNNNQEVVIFASGVSNSKENKIEEFDREEALLRQIITENADKTMVYFSTTSIEDPELSQLRYPTHKKKMENIIREACGRYYIFRLSQVVGKGGNNATLLNYFYHSLIESKKITLWTNAWRQLMDIDDVYIFCHYIIQKKLYMNQTVNIASPATMNVVNIYKLMQEILGITAEFEIEEKGIRYDIQTRELEQLAMIQNIIFNDQYIYDLITKYYKKG